MAFSLFKGKKTSGKTDMSIKQLLTTMLEHNSLFGSGSTSAPSVKRVEQEVFADYAKNPDAGFVLFVYGPGDYLAGFCLFPRQEVESLFDTRGAGCTIEDFLKKLEGSFFDLFFVETEETEETEKGGRLKNCHRVGGTYSRENQPVLLWEALPARLFEIKTGKMTFFLAIDDSLYEEVSFKLDHEAEFARMVEQGISSGFSDFERQGAGDKKGPFLEITKPLEFFWSRFFVPYERRIKGVSFTSRATGLYGPDSCAALEGKPGLWISYQVMCGKESLHFMLFCENAGSELFEKRFSDVNTFALELLKTDLLFLSDVTRRKDITYKVQTAGQAPRGLFQRQDILRLKTRCSIGTLRFSLHALMPVKTAAGLASLMGVAGHQPPLDPAVLILKTNRLLLEKKYPGLTGYYKGQKEEAENCQVYFPFYLLASLVPHRDLTLMLQNHLLQTYPVEYIITLFRYATPRGSVVNFLHYTEEEKIKKALFRNSLERWTEQAKKMSNCSASFKEFARRNRDVMLYLHKSYKEKSLAVSGKTGYLLENCFFREVQQGLYDRIKELAEQDIPFVNVLKLQGRELEVVLNSVPGIMLAQAFLLNNEHLTAVCDLISRSKARLLTEDAAFVKTSFEKGDLDPARVIEAKYTLNGTALDHLHKLQSSIPVQKMTEILQRINSPGDRDFFSGLYGMDETETKYVLRCNPNKEQRFRAFNILFESGSLP